MPSHGTAVRSPPTCAVPLRSAAGEAVKDVVGDLLVLSWLSKTRRTMNSISPDALRCCRSDGRADRCDERAVGCRPASPRRRRPQGRLAVEGEPARAGSRPARRGTAATRLPARARQGRGGGTSRRQGRWRASGRSASPPPARRRTRRAVTIQEGLATCRASLYCHHIRISISGYVNPYHTDTHYADASMPTIPGTLRTVARRLPHGELDQAEPAGTRRRAQVLGAVAALAFALTACGGDDDAADSAAATEPAVTDDAGAPEPTDETDDGAAAAGRSIPVRVPIRTGPTRRSRAPSKSARRDRCRVGLRRRRSPR